MSWEVGHDVLTNLAAAVVARQSRRVLVSFLGHLLAHLVDNHLEVLSVLSREIGEEIVWQGGRKRRWVLGAGKKLSGGERGQSRRGRRGNFSVRDGQPF